MSNRSLISSTIALLASLTLFVGAVAADQVWPETCDQGEEWRDEEDDSTCIATGTIFVIAGIEFCAAECGSGQKLFSMTNPE